MKLERILEEVVEVFCKKLSRLPPMNVGDAFDFHNQVIAPDITNDPLDIAELTMALEDAFGILFQDKSPGDSGLETIKDVAQFVFEELSAMSEDKA